jgi:hypothetical protein
VRLSWVSLEPHNGCPVPVKLAFFTGCTWRRREALRRQRGGYIDVDEPRPSVPSPDLVLPYGTSWVVRGWPVAGGPARRWVSEVEPEGAVQGSSGVPTGRPLGSTASW